MLEEEVLNRKEMQRMWWEREERSNRANQVSSLRIQSLEELVDSQQVALSLAGEALRIARRETDEESE